MNDINDIASVSAEAGIIASVIKKPALTFFCEHLSPKQFTNLDNALIYWACQQLAKKSVEVCDPYNISMMISSKSGTANISSKLTIEAITEVVNLAPLIARDSSDDFMILVDEVLNCSFRRDTIKTLRDCERLAFNTKEENIQGKIYDKIQKIITEYSDSELCNPLGFEIDSIWARISSPEKANDFIDFPFKELNNYCKFAKKELIILSALHKRGKSLFGLNLAVHMLKNNISSLYVDSEIDTDTFTMRLLSHLSGVTFQTIRDRSYTQEEENKIIEAMNWVKKRNSDGYYIIHNHTPVLSEDVMVSLIKQSIQKWQIQAVFIDYLKENSSYSGDAFANSAYLGRMTDTLKTLASKENLFTFAAVQAAGSDAESVSGSKKIIRNCSTLIRLDHKKPEQIQADGGISFGNSFLVIAANRGGSNHSDGEYISIMLDGNTCTFKECPQPELVLPY